MTERKTISKKEGDQLLERYYEGQTSLEEERMVRIFLSSKEADGEAYEVDRAALGLTCALKKRQKKSTFMRYWPTVAAVAACLVLAIGLWNVNADSQSDCIAYINGEKCTDPTVVMQHVNETMSSVTENPEPTVESQMQDVFNSTMNEK